MVRTVPLSIIRSFSLYTQQTLHGSDSSSVHHQEFFTVHTANSTCFGQFLCPSSEFFTVHTANSTCFGQFLCPSSGVFHCTHSKLYMFRTVPLSIIRSFSLYTQQTTCFGQFPCPSSGVFHCTHSIFYMFRTVPLSIIRSFSLYTQQWCMSYRFADSLRPGSGRNYEKLVRLVGFIIRIYHDARSPERQIRNYVYYQHKTPTVNHIIGPPLAFTSYRFDKA